MDILRLYRGLNLTRTIENAHSQASGSQNDVCTVQDPEIHLLVLSSPGFEYSLVSHTTAVAERLGPCVKHKSLLRLPDMFKERNSSMI